jgi:hypothetical protein
MRLGGQAVLWKVLSMPAKPIQIGAIEFPSKSAAEEAIRAILYRYNLGETVMAGDDAFLRDLIALHSEAEAKINTGILRFTIELDPVWRKTRHFYVWWKDGGGTDFSFKNCVNGKNPRQDIFAALRYAIFDQVTRFKRERLAEGACTCPITGVELTEKNCHVDHRSPETFNALAIAWMVSEGLTIDRIRLVDNQHNQYVREIASVELTRSWKVFHAERAKLRLLESKANLSAR